MHSSSNISAVPMANSTALRNVCWKNSSDLSNTPPVMGWSPHGSYWVRTTPSPFLGSHPNDCHSCAELLNELIGASASRLSCDEDKTGRSSVDRERRIGLHPDRFSAPDPSSEPETRIPVGLRWPGSDPQGPGRLAPW